MNTTLSDSTINVQWPSHGHVGVFKESITILLMIVPSIGTSMVALRLTCARLHSHVSGAERPLAANSLSDRNSGWSFVGSTSSLHPVVCLPCVVSCICLPGFFLVVWKCKRAQISLKATIDVPMLGTITEQNGGGLLEESHLPVGWPLHIDGAVRQCCSSSY